jgi:hypothetical protein
MDEQNNIPEFAILQNSRTKVTGLWTKERGEWIQADESEYEILGMIAKLIRTSKNPVEVLEAIKQAAKKQTNWDVEPGFFIPPEELDGLE